MEFPPDWGVEPLDDFDIAVATLVDSGDAVAIELLAQLRPTGRILDNFHFSVNGHEILNVELDSSHREREGLQAQVPILAQGHQHQKDPDQQQLVGCPGPSGHQQRHGLRS